MAQETPAKAPASRRYLSRASFLAPRARRLRADRDRSCRLRLGDRSRSLYRRRSRAARLGGSASSSPDPLRNQVPEGRPADLEIPAAEEVARVAAGSSRRIYGSGGGSGRSSQSMRARKREKYSVAETIATITATHSAALPTIAKTSQRSARMSSEIATICDAILALPQTDAGITIPSLAAIDRSPVTANSRATMMTTIQAGATPISTSEMNAADTRSLSAIGSRSVPSFVI